MELTRVWGKGCRQTSIEKGGRGGRDTCAHHRGPSCWRGVLNTPSLRDQGTRGHGAVQCPLHHEMGGPSQAPRTHVSAPHLLKPASLSEMEPSQAGESWLTRRPPLTLWPWYKVTHGRP